jgi:hypothetical protein
MIIEEVKHLCPDWGSDQLKQSIPPAYAQARTVSDFWEQGLWRPSAGTTRWASGWAGLCAKRFPFSRQRKIMSTTSLHAMNIYQGDSQD